MTGIVMGLPNTGPSTAPLTHLERAGRDLRASASMSPLATNSRMSPPTSPRDIGYRSNVPYAEQERSWRNSGLRASPDNSAGNSKLLETTHTPTRKLSTAPAFPNLADDVRQISVAPAFPNLADDEVLSAGVPAIKPRSLAFEGKFSHMPAQREGLMSPGIGRIGVSPYASTGDTSRVLEGTRLPAQSKVACLIVLSSVVHVSVMFRMH